MDLVRLLIVGSLLGTVVGMAWGQAAVELPPGVRAVWDLGKAWRETTPTRERVCLNGLWRWQPAAGPTETVPEGNWGYHKVPGPWPGLGFYMYRESQRCYVHPAWADQRLADVDMAWYQREFTVPADWAGRRITLSAEYLNSLAVVYVDGARVGELTFPGGELDLTPAVQPGRMHALSLFVAALPLNEELVSYAAAEAAQRSRSRVERRGLCGDVFLCSNPSGPRLTDLKIETSVREHRITCRVRCAGLAEGPYVLHAQVMDGDAEVLAFDSEQFGAGEASAAPLTLSASWPDPRLWDLNTPQNQYDLKLSLLDGRGTVLDELPPTRFGFREFWIEGRDFMLNGTRLYCFAVPLDNAQMATASATYEGARETLARLKRLGVNLVYTHNYGCEPGAHLSFTDILRAADDVGMLVSLSQPHASAYQWDAPDADTSNGYADLAAFYVRVAQNHPAVVMYALNHNMMGYAQDMNPDLMDGRHDNLGRLGERNDGNARLAKRTEDIVRRLDSTRVIYHHSSGNCGQLYTSNCYLNFVPIQGRSDWLESWATQGVKPVFFCEYGAPLGMSWTMHRGWYKGERSFTNGRIQHEFCCAEWGAQFRGDAAFDLTDKERQNLRFEARKWREGGTWYRWDYPFEMHESDFDAPNMLDVQAMYIRDNWPAFRTWGLSAFNLWSHRQLWHRRPGFTPRPVTFDVDWENLQRPGFSPDFLETQYEGIEVAYEYDDWEATPAAEVFLRLNQPLLAYLAGKPARFTSKDHLFVPGERVEKQAIVINNSRETVTCRCQWSLDLPHPLTGGEEVTVATGNQARVTIGLALPDDTPAGMYVLSLTATFSTGEVQTDRLDLTVMPAPAAPRVSGRVALFDPLGDTRNLLAAQGFRFNEVAADADLAGYDVLIIGRGALTPDGAGPELSRVREGLKVLVFEQERQVLEQRLGFRVQEYGLRQVFPRVPDHPALAGLTTEHLRDWRGQATLVPPRLEYQFDPHDSPFIMWCGIRVTRPWRCGTQGNVASVVIEKPARGDFLPVVDGGYGLEYSPLLEYREGQGLVLFCQMDVTGRTEEEPAAQQLLGNLLRYVLDYAAPLGRRVVYAGAQAGRDHLTEAGYAPSEAVVGDLVDTDVLVVTPDGEEALAAQKAALGQWLADGGRMLALGLDGEALSALLPAPVTTQKAEHIACNFAPPPSASPFAGVSPAEVNLREPRQLPLVTAGAVPLGDGVLAAANGGRVVVCQIAPWDFRYEQQFNLKRTYRRTSCLLARLLSNLGARAQTPLLDRFARPVSADVTGQEPVSRNGDFARDADGDGVADEWSVSGDGARVQARREPLAGEGGRWAQVIASAPQEGAQRPSAMLAQMGVPLAEGQWYHLSFRARAEGMAGSEVLVAVNHTRSWTALLEYRRFYPGTEWQRFEYWLQATGTEPTNTRLQIWHGNAGELWLSDLRLEPCAPPTEGRWLNGLYLDAPTEMDDPYRFFRW